MRIGIVTQSYHPVLGGVTEHVQGLAISLLRRGHEIAVITGKSGAALSSEEMRLRRAGGEIVRVGQPYRVRCNGASVTIVGEPGLSSGLRAIPRNRFDVVHIHSPLEPFLPTAAAFWFDAPLVGTFHSAGRRGRGYRVFRPLLAPVVQRLAVRTAGAASARVCPNCGATRGEGQTVVCEYCGGKISTGEFPWILSRIEQDEAYLG